METPDRNTVLMAEVEPRRVLTCSHGTRSRILKAAREVHMLPPREDLDTSVCFSMYAERVQCAAADQVSHVSTN